MAKKRHPGKPGHPPKPAPPAHGRTAGSKNRAYEIVRDSPTACHCGSTERTPYRTKVEHAIAGTIDGKPYTHVVWRPTQCVACGQWRKDKSFEDRSHATD